ncbi:hypothetical protein MANES_15G082101v8 [Manihot esculenta]|uniref:Uncharacterized protein n=1 Tax=Manihot esculenta TaxID=3983 RepID=A0A2C9UE96_MANES|nr:hypothetical protein MANES_15G082101v8 [Manihot esculenta]
MGVRSGAWIVAASIGMKNHGICTWNYVITSLHNNITSLLPPPPIFSSFSYLPSITHEMGDVQIKKLEDSFEKIMRLGCWGPNTIRF